MVARTALNVDEVGWPVVDSTPAVPVPRPAYSGASAPNESTAPPALLGVVGIAVSGHKQWENFSRAAAYWASLRSPRPHSAQTGPVSTYVGVRAARRIEVGRESSMSRE